MPEQREVKFTINGEEQSMMINVATVDENLKSLKQSPLRIATIDYLATGEGRTVYLLAKRPVTQEEFFKWCIEKSSNWFVQGGTFYENILPEGDVVFQELASDFIKDLWKEILAGKTESGWYEYSACHYFNLS